jgi:hypothetical protein
MVEVERVNAETIHLPVALVDEALALAVQRAKIARGHDAVQERRSSPHETGARARTSQRTTALAAALEAGFGSYAQF